MIVSPYLKKNASSPESSSLSEKENLPRGKLKSKLLLFMNLSSKTDPGAGINVESLTSPLLSP
jgi:hypothetical protein